ncbi:hypothetical protein M409DRAFT_57252 [Zasmidium cellare ATCC 36951]|uniref:Uncharacterized protein n=1 Tax=Zasmidium cellare ATCC 36951 TaxID=1080233 RepID=A0A6A6CDM9_ZASCE|nr:uncharacterized protein M409DRAFT_57252 [Zasmidium cellare ATCC 36951]KAF2163769.1 hypothetical protein M409DRAFT_57252 [Zasmidium cellare ATCC 36951]
MRHTTGSGNVFQSSHHVSVDNPMNVVRSHTTQPSTSALAWIPLRLERSKSNLVGLSGDGGRGEVSARRRRKARGCGHAQQDSTESGEEREMGIAATMDERRNGREKIECRERPTGKCNSGNTISDDGLCHVHGCPYVGC